MNDKQHKRIVFAGMRPTGRLHLGNYLGSAKGMLELQKNPDYETMFMVMDYHGITTPYDHSNYVESVKNVMRDYLAIGLDPDKSILTAQSLVPEHLELAYLFSTVTTIAKMSHLPTFKEKIKQYPQHNTMALLNYPVLMAADILVYKAELVPVGIDQEPHLEVAREIARRMNQEFGTSFPEPVRFATAGEYVPSLLGEGKMSKSVEGSYIALTDDLETVQKKVARIPTDSGRGSDIKQIELIMKFVELFLGEQAVKEYSLQYVNEGIRYGELKSRLSEAIYNELKPVQERIQGISDEYVMKVIREGAEGAREKAAQTLREVKMKMGLMV